jgi:hypothetical protein
MAATTLTLKLTEDLVSQLGGVSTAEEKIKGLLVSEKSAADLRAEIGKLVQLCELNAKSIGAIDERLKAAESTAAKPAVAEISAEQIKTIANLAEEAAKLAAAKEVSAVIAKAGQSSIVSSNATTETATAAPSGVGATDAERDAYWAAHPELAKDFVDSKSWKAYQRASDDGRVVLHKSRN